MGEDGGANLYAFIGNDSIAHIDALGLFNYDKKTRTFEVFKCEILIVFGRTDPKAPYKFRFPRGGGAIGYAACFPDMSLAGVDDSKRLKGQLPSGLQCNWNAPPRGAVRNRIDSDLGEGVMPFDGQALLAALEDSVGEKVKELCENGCKSIAVRYYRSADGDNDTAIPALPKDQTFICRCQN